jgi:hypothetical protein
MFLISFRSCINFVSDVVECDFTAYQQLKARAELQRNPFAPPSARDPPPLHLQEPPPYGLDPSTAVVAVGRAGANPLSPAKFMEESQDNFLKARTTYLAQKDNAERATDPFSDKPAIDTVGEQKQKPHAPAPYALDKYDESTTERRALKNTGAACSPRDLGKGHTILTSNSYRIEANSEYQRNHNEYVTLKNKNKKATSLLSDERKAMERKRLESVGLLPENVKDIAHLGLL